MKYICELDGKVFTDYDDAWNHVADWFTNDDFIDYAKKIGRFDEMMYDLMDHDTDLAQEIHGQAIEEFFKDNVFVDMDDEILEVMSERPHDILNELRRLDSPLFWEFHKIAKDRYLNEYVHEIEEDEEDEEPCCEDCDHYGSHGDAINQPCMWCEEYSEFERKRFV